MNTIKDLLQWRYATKKFDTSKELLAADLEYILEAGNLAATSFGLQPFGIVVVTDKEKKQKLQAAAYGQEQVGENNALLIICTRTDVDVSFIETFVQNIEKIRGLVAGTTNDYKNIMINSLTNQSPEKVLTWSQKQSYIVLGTMMVAAAEKHIDSCPMEGFDAEKFTAILGLAEHHLTPTTLLPVGFRSAEDATQHDAKVRRELSDVVVRI